jgi:hypothetical protein
MNHKSTMVQQVLKALVGSHFELMEPHFPNYSMDMITPAIRG